MDHAVRGPRLDQHETELVRRDGGEGADLDFDRQTESQTSGIIGLKWAGNFGGIIPEAKLAYRHDFGGDIGVESRFAFAPAGSSFRKEEERKEGSIIAGLSLAGAINSDLYGRLGYQGRFNDEVKDHAIYGSLTYLFGAPRLRRLRRLRRRRRRLRQPRRARTVR